ncbi:hypothetical protein N7G274_005334 [Stereocaulon virgatum]|uniref:Uncharacterized protein n=1 Tax=Stereocaulon virgatum TaxID=373712 RepID=A0ABR4A9R8_9LECA
MLKFTLSMRLSPSVRHKEPLRWISGIELSVGRLGVAVTLIHLLGSSNAKSLLQRAMLGSSSQNTVNRLLQISRLSNVSELDQFLMKAEIADLKRLCRTSVLIWRTSIVSVADPDAA